MSRHDLQFGAERSSLDFGSTAPATITAQTAPTAAPFRGAESVTPKHIQIFNTLLTSLLTKAQGLSAEQLRAKELTLGQEALRRGAEPLIGQERLLSPAQQARVRGARVSPIQAERGLVQASREERENKIERLPGILKALGDFVDEFSPKDTETTTTFKNWVLAGGEEGTGLNYTDFFKQVKKIGVAEGDYPNVSPQDRINALTLAVSRWGKRNGAKYVPLLLQMMNDDPSITLDDIDDRIRNSEFSSEFEGVYRNSFEFVTKKGFSALDKVDNRDALDRLLEDGETGQARDFLLGLARDSTTGILREQVIGRDIALDSLDHIDNLLDEFIAKGGETGIITGSLEKLKQNILGQTNNPELAEIGNTIAIAIQTYRKAVSGAAFTESEAKEYRGVFPGIDKVEELNKALIESLRDVFNRNQDEFYRLKIGPENYDALFGEVPITGDLETRYNQLGFDESFAEMIRIHGGEKIQQVIQQKEGSPGFSQVGGDTNLANRPQRNNNPGNVKAGGLGDRYAVGQDDQGHLIFDNPEDGFKALREDIQAKIQGQSRFVKKDPTIQELGRVYAEDTNWSNRIASILGVNINTKLNDIDFNKLINAIARQEGFFA